MKIKTAVKEKANGVRLKWYLAAEARTYIIQVPGGTQIWVGQGCAARASKPIPIFKGDFGQKGYPLLRIFLQK